MPLTRPRAARAIATAMPPLLLLSLASCTVGPDYHPPQTAVPQAWAEPTELGPNSAEATVSRWWSLLKDQQLEDLINRAVTANLDLRVAEARIRQARAQRGISAAAQWPTVNVDGSYTRERFSENATGAGNFGNADSAGRDLYQIGFDASWELDIFGRVRRSVEAADAGIGSAVENRRDVLVTLLSEVAVNYVQARAFQSRLRIADSNIRSQQQALDLTRARFQAGLGTDLDVARAEAQLATTESVVPQLQTGLKQSVHALAVLLGDYPGPLLGQFASQEIVPVPAIPPDVPIGLPSDLLLRRPDIRRAERNLASATANIGVATADLFPRVALKGTLGLSANQIGDLPEGNSRFWSIGPSLTWPIFDAGRIRSNIALQTAVQEESLATYQRTVLTAFRETEDAIVAYSREQVRRKSLAEAVASNQRAVDLANQLYTRGLTDFLSVIDAQRNLFLSQDQLAQSDGIVTTNLVALYKALGGGWEEFEPQPPPEPPHSSPGAVPDPQPSPTGPQPAASDAAAVTAMR